MLRLAMLLHDTGKPEIATRDEKGIYHFRGHAAGSAVIAGRVMKRLKFDNYTASRVCRLVKNHSLYPSAIRRECAEGFFRWERICSRISWR